MAPFYSLVGNIIDHTAIIHDLNVVTTITTDGHYAGGMVGYVYHSASISNGGQAIAVAPSGSTGVLKQIATFDCTIEGCDCAIGAYDCTIEGCDWKSSCWRGTPLGRSLGHPFPCANIQHFFGYCKFLRSKEVGLGVQAAQKHLKRLVLKWGDWWHVGE